MLSIRSVMAAATLAGFAWFAGPVLATTLTKQALGAAGGDGTSASHLVSFTLGLPAIGPTSSAKISVIAGFWFAGTGVIGVRDALGETGATRLHSNFPNPFRGQTSLAFEIAGSGKSVVDTRLDIYDVQGRLVKTLVREPLLAGHHRVAWDGTDASRQRVPSGIYLGRLTVGGESRTIRLVTVD